MAGIALECLQIPEMLMVFESIKYISTFLNQKIGQHSGDLTCPDLRGMAWPLSEVFYQVNKGPLLLWLSHCHWKQLCYYYEREESLLGHFSGPVVDTWLSDQSALDQSAIEEKSLVRWGGLVRRNSYSDWMGWTSIQTQGLLFVHTSKVLPRGRTF